MEYFLTPHAPAIDPYYWWDGAFSQKELDWLQEKAIKAEERAQAGGFSNTEDLKNYRRSQVSWLFNNQENEWVFKRLADITVKLNSQFFHFDLTGFGEPLQLTNYDQSEHGMYGWHQDYNAPISRKISLVLQLTDPAQYEGGNLQIMTAGEPINVRKQRGLIAAFPSYVVHQVTPVVQGSRQSLVTWVSGPAFK